MCYGNYYMQELEMHGKKKINIYILYKLVDQ